MVSVSEYCNSFKGSGNKWSKRKIPDLDSNRYRIEDDCLCCCYRLIDVEEFYYDDDICEYIMKLTEGYEYEGK